MYKAELDTETKLNVVLVLFKNVMNTRELREAVISGKLKCCIIKPALILDPFQVVVAANKAAVSQIQEKMSTRTIFSEILFNLSITKNISQSLVKFGIEDSEKNIIVCVLNKDNEGDVEQILSQVQGERCCIEELNNLKDLNLIKETYKIRDSELLGSSLLESIVSRIATKDIVSVTN